ncbi:sugar transferase [Pseudooceanicola sp. CBS1P-1]|uniref:Sugar transferase n=2 Tax=Paracoccaceae TaxID=31989 RepID=A0A6L7GBT6_9RHOB|nr:sugar transferase [Pseudooceanicola endophyticus]MXN20786.1 sugar transferase [Pseudooceanicola albus]
MASPRAWRASVRSLSDTMYTRFVKRVFDLVLALMLLPVLLPVIAVLWILIRRDGGPGFFGHRRLGHNGKSFRCWKIRTMVVDAEARLTQHLANNPEAAEEWKRDQKLTNDPRITKLGHLLRATSLDELPQIWNVLKGEMSFVGPRPITRDEIRRYGKSRVAYLSMRPGLTGLWQVSGRNDVTYDERVAMDVEYAKKASFLMDCKLLVKTFNAVLGQTGR